MKIKTSIVLLLSVAVISLSSITASAATPAKLGDVNADGNINVTDISIVAAHVKGIKALDKDAQKRADINKDGKINVTDISLLSAHVKGIKPIVDNTDELPPDWDLPDIPNWG